MIARCHQRLRMVYISKVQTCIFIVWSGFNINMYLYFRIMDSVKVPAELGVVPGGQLKSDCN